MSWSSAGPRIFDPVAKALTEHHVPGEVITATLAGLIDVLQENDWDTEADSLEAWADHPDVVAAFDRCGVKP